MKKALLVVLVLLLPFTITTASIGPKPEADPKSDWICMPYQETSYSTEVCKASMDAYVEIGIITIAGLRNLTAERSMVIITFTMIPSYEVTGVKVIGAVFVALKAYPGTDEVLIYYGDKLGHYFKVKGSKLCHKLP